MVSAGIFFFCWHSQWRGVIYIHSGFIGKIFPSGCGWCQEGWQGTPMWDDTVSWQGLMTGWWQGDDRGDLWWHGNMQHWHCFLNARISWSHWTGNIWSLPTVLLLQCLARGDAEAGEAGEVWCESDTVHTEGRGASSQPRDKCLMESFTSRDARSGGILKLLLLS